MRIPFIWRKRLGVIWSVAKAGLLAVLLVGLMMWLAGSFLSKVAPGAPLADPAPRAARSVPVDKVSIPLPIEQIGTVRARREAGVASRLLARVEEVGVEVGQEVSGPGGETPGDLLVRLDARDLEAARRQAEAGSAAAARGVASARSRVEAARMAIVGAEAEETRAQADLQRYTSMFDGGAATREQIDRISATARVVRARRDAARQAHETAMRELERAESQAAAAGAAVEAARVREEHALIRAPFSGRVIDKLVEVGDTVAPGQVLVQLEEDAAFDLVSDISESLAIGLSTGQRLQVRIDASQATLQGTVREVRPSSDTASHTMRVKVALPADADLVSGLAGRLLIPHGRVEVILCPRQAVRRVGQLDLVDVVDSEGKVSRRFVRVGRSHGDRVEITSGLREGDEVVLP